MVRNRATPIKKASWGAVHAGVSTSPSFLSKMRTIQTAMETAYSAKSLSRYSRDYGSMTRRVSRLGDCRRHQPRIVVDDDDEDEDVEEGKMHLLFTTLGLIYVH